MTGRRCFGRGAVRGLVPSIHFLLTCAAGAFAWAIPASPSAAEATADALFAQADKAFGPVRERGGLRYPHHYKDQKFKVSSTHDKVIAMARSNRPGGLAAMHHHPWGDEDFKYPLVEGIDFPRVLVAEARWNPDRAALTVELRPGFEAPASTEFRVVGGAPGDSWTLTRDGAEIVSLGPDNIATGALARSKEDAPGVIRVKAPLDGPCRMELRRGR